MASEFEMQVVAVERVQEYTKCPQEVISIIISHRFLTSYRIKFLFSYKIKIQPFLKLSMFLILPFQAPAYISSTRPPSDWPNHGSVEIKHLFARYRQNADLVLNDITCSIRASEKVCA